MKEVQINISSDSDLIGTIPDPIGRTGFHTFSYKGGGTSRIPEDFFSSWKGSTDTPGFFYIGKCSGLGTGSYVKFNYAEESLKIGRYVSAGIETAFMLGGFHETNCISTCEFGSYDSGLENVRQRQYKEIEVKNDVWFGDSCLIMADSIVENGCIIGARSLLPLHFKSEPFGIYVGSPARLKKFRFSEKVCELLLDIAWWDMPFSWIKENNKAFLFDMTSDGAIDVLQELKAKKESYAG